MGPPETVYVRVTGQSECSDVMTYHVEVVPFKDYVKGVLPNEWFRTWEEEALKAGAVAVKMYGWSINNSQGFLWDCTWNQVYDPLDRTPETDQAVDDTWDWWLLNKRLKPMRTYFNADKFGCATQGPNCMSQIGSQYLATEYDLTWKEILNSYYDGFLIEGE